jgi:hypothetical protein
MRVMAFLVLPLARVSQESLSAVYARTFEKAAFGFAKMYVFCLFMRVLLSWFPGIDWNVQPWTFLRLVGGDVGAVGCVGQVLVCSVLQRGATTTPPTSPPAAAHTTLNNPHHTTSHHVTRLRSPSPTSRSIAASCRPCLASSTSRRSSASSSCR